MIRTRNRNWNHRQNSRVTFVTIWIGAFCVLTLKTDTPGTGQLEQKSNTPFHVNLAFSEGGHFCRDYETKRGMRYQANHTGIDMKEFAHTSSRNLFMVMGFVPVDKRAKQSLSFLDAWGMHPTFGLDTKNSNFNSNEITFGHTSHTPWKQNRNLEKWKLQILAKITKNPKRNKEHFCNGFIVCLNPMVTKFMGEYLKVFPEYRAKSATLHSSCF